MDIIFSTLKNTYDKNPVNQSMPLPDFVDFICDTSRRMSVDPAWTKAEYDAAKIKQRAIASVGGRRKDSVTELSVVFMDFDHLSARQYRTLTKAFRGANFFNIMHTTASHLHACKGGDRAFRVLIPTVSPFDANDAWLIQRQIMVTLGLDDSLRDKCTEDGNRLVYLPHRESEITITEGRTLGAQRYIKKALEAGMTKRERKEMVADESGLNAGIAAYCEFDLGLEALSSGRGYEVPCPNEHLHTGKGSTSIMLDGKEVRFVCQHTNNGACTALNRRQHLALSMVGLPDELNVEKQPISIASIREALPDLPMDEVEHIHRQENAERIVCDIDDLEEEEEPQARAEFIVEGYMPSNCIWNIVGESGTYKSFYTLGMMYISAAGFRFAGADTRPAHHFYIDGEGGENTHTRIEALVAKYGDAGMKYMHVIDASEYNLETDSKALVRAIKRIAGNEPVGMVAFDTLNQTFGSAIPKFNENSSGQDGMGRVVSLLKEIKAATGGAVGVVHHTPKGGNKARGSGALYAGVDVELSIVRATDRQINVTHSKYKMGPQQKTVGMVLESVQFRPAPPPKVFQADDFGTPDASYGEIANLDLPEPHKALVLMPWGFAQFETDEEKEKEKAEGLDEKGKKAVRDTVRGKSQKESVMAALEELQTADDTGAGFTHRQIVATSGDTSITNITLSKMLDAGELMCGCDKNGEVVTNTYRLPSKIDDWKRPKNNYEENPGLKITEEDLE